MIYAVTNKEAVIGGAHDGREDSHDTVGTQESYISSFTRVVELLDKAKNDSKSFTRARLLKLAAISLAGAAAFVTGRQKEAKAATGDFTTLGGSGNTGDPNLAEDATEVQFDGPTIPGVIFLAQADSKYSPSGTAYASALAGWTSTNPDIMTGVYGYSERQDGNGVVGWARDGTLANGTGTVQLDPDFAALVHTDSFHVFLTPKGDSMGLYVSSSTATGFTVREQQGGTNSLAFDYRVVAKRKDVAAPRLAKVELPAMPAVAGVPTPLA